MRAKFIIYQYQHKGDQAIIDRTIVLELKDTSQTFEGVVIIESPPPPDIPLFTDTIIPLY